jgi:hypothetical protein
MELGTKRRETILVVDDNYAITVLVKAFQVSRWRGGRCALPGSAAVI